MSVYIYATLLFFFYARKWPVRKGRVRPETLGVDQYFEQFRQQIAFPH